MIKLTIKELFATFQIVKEMIEVNGQPFTGHAKRLLYKMQPELEYLQKADKEDVEAVADKELNFGEYLPSPQHYPQEYKQVLEKVCGELPEKETQIEKLLSNE